jgi:hypothetical protein
MRVGVSMKHAVGDPQPEIRFGLEANGEEAIALTRD